MECYQLILTKQRPLLPKTYNAYCNRLFTFVNYKLLAIRYNGEEINLAKIGFRPVVLLILNILDCKNVVKQQQKINGAYLMK